MNRIDKTVVFHPLGTEELRKILSLELNLVQQRIFTAGNSYPFVFNVSDASRDFLLREGTDMKYGARHLKRAVDRHLLHPLSNLMATGQVRGGDLIRVDFDSDSNMLTFFKDAEDIPSYVMAGMVDTSVALPSETPAATAAVRTPQLIHNAKTTKR